MSNPFDDLESDEGADDESESDVTPVREEPAVAKPDPEPIQEEPIETDPADAGPAFEYSEVRQKPIYARGETWDEFEKTFRTTIAPQLAESGVVDEETREAHDALLKLAIEQPERVAEIMLEARRQS
ncbi:hypothetical protein HYG81_23955 (plasmid) [Natrinema zhouii]|uniref:hypothetical protein n=1 Tax=Natrinema zhouii TaxID=1710539 RepID=UPI001CFFCD06|nr:hypothetical protein [Natrinema zhouii]UHQ98837.1 hypothetical protein HYG81_23955 [Natrinema zhouii]